MTSDNVLALEPGDSIIDLDGPWEDELTGVWRTP